MVWVEFAICAGLMIVSAYALCIEGMTLASVTHIEEGVIGIFFLAVATSFPEIVVGVSSVSYLDRVALGYGDLLGSVMINSMLVIGVDYFASRSRVLSGLPKMSFTTVLFWAGIAAVIIAAAVIRRYFNLFSIGPFGVESFVILGLYFTYLVKLKRNGSPDGNGGKAESDGSFKKSSEKSVARMWARFVALIVVVMVLGVWMAAVGEKIAVSTGLSHTFVGATLLALVTSFPEIVVSFAAVRAGSVDMAMGNIFGSNLFDLSILPILDAFTKGPITGGLTFGQISVTVMALLIPVILMRGMRRAAPDRGNRVGINTSMVFAAGMAGLAILYFIE